MNDLPELNVASVLASTHRRYRRVARRVAVVRRDRAADPPRADRPPAEYGTRLAMAKANAEATASESITSRMILAGEPNTACLTYALRGGSHGPRATGC